MNESQGVVYLLTGQAHAVRTLVSISGLRQFYDGPITLFTARDETHGIGETIALDQQLAVNHVRTEELKSVPRKNRQFITKVKLMANSPYDVTMYLDGDTLPVGDISPLFRKASEHQFCATQFNDWVTTGSMMSKRIMRWVTEVAPSVLEKGDGDLPYPKHEPKRQSMAMGNSQSAEGWIKRLADQAINPTMPAVNGGCFAARRDAEILEHWFNLSMFGRRTFICDEIALQLLLREYPNYILEGGQYNCSSHLGTHIKDPVVLHYHGEKHLNRDASRESWVPAYNRCLENNLGNIRKWTPAGDPSLIKILESQKEAKYANPEHA